MPSSSLVYGGGNYLPTALSLLGPALFPWDSVFRGAMLIHIWGLAFCTSRECGDLTSSVVVWICCWHWLFALMSRPPLLHGLLTCSLKLKDMSFLGWIKISILWFKHGLNGNAFHLNGEDWCLKLGHVSHAQRRLWCRFKEWGSWCTEGGAEILGPLTMTVRSSHCSRFFFFSPVQEPA